MGGGWSDLKGGGRRNEMERVEEWGGLSYLGPHSYPPSLGERALSKQERDTSIRRDDDISTQLSVCQLDLLYIIAVYICMLHIELCIPACTAEMLIYRCISIN